MAYQGTRALAILVKSKGWHTKLSMKFWGAPARYICIPLKDDRCQHGAARSIVSQKPCFGFVIFFQINSCEGWKPFLFVISRVELLDTEKSDFQFPDTGDTGTRVLYLVHCQCINLHCSKFPPDRKSVFPFCVLSYYSCVHYRTSYDSTAVLQYGSIHRSISLSYCAFASQ